jgi:arylsulfatase A-like enzyme
MQLSNGKLSALLIGCYALSSCSTGQKKHADAARPNIIFIVTDDHRHDALGYAGNNIIRTPQMDRLAGEGTWFSHAIVTTPISAASRASILTGMYERTHGYTFQQGPLKEPYMQLSYPVLMRMNGYHTGFFGKLGVTYKGAETLFDEADIYDRNGKYPDRRGYFFRTIGDDTVHLTRFTGYQAQQFIKNAPHEKPFCLSLSFSAPHAHDNSPEQYFWQEKSDSLYNNITIPPPPLKEDQYFNALPAEVKVGFNRLRWTWRFDTPDKYQHSVKGYYRMISEIDDELGEIRQLLVEKGIEKNTIIIIIGDNGYYLGERQLAGKWLMHDISIRVPLIIYDPRVKNHRDINDMVLNIDMAATMLDFAGIEIPKEYQGISLQPYLRKSKHAISRDCVLIEHLWKLPEIPSSEGIRTPHWKYFRYRFIDTPEELYNLDNDPLETKNLATDPACRDILEKLRKECNRQIRKYTGVKLVSDYTPADEIDTNY